MLHFVYPGPDGQELIMRDVVVTSLAENGEYSLEAKVGLHGMRGIKPGFGRLVDDAGDLVEPSLPQEAASISPDMLAALQLLLGGV